MKGLQVVDEEKYNMVAPVKEWQEVEEKMGLIL